MINGKTIITASILALAIGCQNAGEKQVDERKEAGKEIADATKSANKDIADAKEDLSKAQEKYGEKVADAQDKITDEVKEAGKEIADADKEAAKELNDARYERFDIIENEGEPAFATRANAALARLDADLATATGKAGKASDEKLNKALADAKNSLAEAKKDLAELRGKTGKVFDDGRIGVGVAINDAQRALTDAFTQIATLKM